MTKKSTTEVAITVKVKGKLSVTLSFEEAHELKDALDIALGVRRIAQLEERIEGILKQSRWAEPSSTFTSYPPIVVLASLHRSSPDFHGTSGEIQAQRTE